VSEDRSVLIEEEIIVWRETSGKMRSILYKALLGGTKQSLEQGCHKALSLLDFFAPSRKRIPRKERGRPWGPRGWVATGGATPIPR